MIAVSATAKPALAERLALYEEANPGVVVTLSTPRDIAHVMSLANDQHLPCLLDVNRATARLAFQLATAKRSYIVDTGDHAESLSRGLQHGILSREMRRGVESWVLRHAQFVIVRGYFHGPVLLAELSITSAWVPDTAPDWLFETKLPEGSPKIVATFGTTAKPRRTGGRIYGQEVLDLVESDSSLTGIIVARGSGETHLRDLSRARGLGPRVEILGALPLRSLVEVIAAAAFITSVQSDDLAGWVRTTGKLPIILAAGRCPITTCVGEAARILPPELLVPSTGARLQRMLQIVASGPPNGWGRHAARLANQYRRGEVAMRLREILRSI